MREMSAAEASRHFSELLDAVERGETIVVRRKGRQVATIAPAPRANAVSFDDVVAEWRGNAAFDDAFAENVAAARDAVDPELDRDPWHD